MRQEKENLFIFWARGKSNKDTNPANKASQNIITSKFGITNCSHKLKEPLSTSYSGVIIKRNFTNSFVTVG